MDIPATVPRTFRELFWIHVSIASNQPRMPGSPRLLHCCFHQGFMPRRPTFRVPTVHGNDPHTSSDIHPRLGDSSFVSWDPLNRPFFCSHDWSQVAVDCHRNSSWRVLTILTACRFRRNSRCTRCKPPFFLGLFIELLLHFLLPQSVLYLKKKISHFPLYLLMYFFSVLQGDPFSKVHLSIFASVLSSPSGCRHLCGISSTHLLSFTCTS